MGITLRHDAAAVVPPSNQTTRKYGQSLVLQQNTQKYNQQQAGYDRLFQLGRDSLQNQAQMLRDNNQIAFQVNQAKDRNAFMLDRDKALFERQQQQQEAERQRAFMDEARKQSGGMIMQDIQNGEFDPATSRKLQQNLVAESEALGNPNLDATQRAEALAKIRAERATLTANRQQKPPPPSAQEQFDQGVVTGSDGTQYRQNSKGDFEPLPKQPQRPTSVDDAIRENPKALDKYMDYAIQIETKGGDEPLTEKSLAAARERARKQLEQDLGLGTPTAAPSLPGAPPAAANPGEQRSILEDPLQVTPPDPGMPPSPGPAGMPVAPPDPGMPPSPPAKPLVSDASLEVDAQMTAQGYKLVTPPDGSRPYYYKDATAGQGSSTIPATPGASQNAFEEAPSTNQPVYPPSDWEELMAGTPAATPAAPTPAAPTPTPASPPAAAPKAAPTPDFGKLTASAADDADRGLVSSLQGIYGSQSPEAQSAINVILSENALPEELRAARDYLKSVGVDIEQMTAPKPTGGRRGKSK